MPRKPRIEYAGAVYHVLNRGDRRELIVRDDVDRERFVETLADCCLKTDWQVHAYCLMPNHFHLVLETPNPNLVAGMKWFLGTYTARFNRRHRLCGHLFSGRYKALVVDASSPGYLRTVCDYVHLNPARAKLLTPDQPLRDYPWSSFPSYLQRSARRPAWLRVDRLFGEHGVPRDTAAGREVFERRTEAQRRADDPSVYHGLRRGWCLGDERFRQELLEQMTGRMGANHYGADRQENDEAKAERIVAAELARDGRTEADLKSRRKGDPMKVRLAACLRRETTMTLRWIAQRLCMGTWTHVSNCLAATRTVERSVKSED